MLNRILSQVCGRWYLPVFYWGMDHWPLCILTLIVIARFQSSLPTILKLSTVVFVTCDVAMVINWGRRPWGVPWMSHQKVLLNHQYTSHHMLPCHTCILSITPLFWIMVTLSLEANRRLYHPLKYTCIRYFLHTFLKLSLRPLMYGTIIFWSYMWLAWDYFNCYRWQWCPSQRKHTIVKNNFK